MMKKLSDRTEVLRSNSGSFFAGRLLMPYLVPNQAQYFVGQRFTVCFAEMDGDFIVGGADSPPYDERLGLTMPMFLFH